ncbi:MAG TPA: ABC transporter permease [Cyanobacteria bacterium UBA11369]|nr:ABC transporter permease [Cyanobacteria bacterium UBA11371]HBE32252.1 ABC transporter permease [Cyanobacteria bacterium UBA11368]HBE51671.1 ABC transporter permease [Cyanobacteria bacterium UBA11369]
MKLPWLDRIGDWNPQLLRELNGRLKPRNVLIAIAISLFGQFLLFQVFQSQLPIPPEPGEYKYRISNQFCTGNPDYEGAKIYQCLRDPLGNFIINWQQWWLSVFVFLSFVGIFALLVIGTYMLIADLTNEERKGSLNFIRLSPESTPRLLIGKMLGVPILVYLLTALALPLHLFAGLSAQISLGEILAFYAVVVACCIFFYSTALLYGLVSNWLGGFQAWLGAGAVLSFLWVTASLATYVPIYNPLAWARLIAPFDLIPHLYTSSLSYQNIDLQKLQWFYLPLGANGVFLLGFALLNYALWTYWVWQGLQRCFRNQNATILSKSQSYLFTACFTCSTLGFSLPGYTSPYLTNNPKEWLFQHLAVLCLFDLFLFLYLLAALLPHRQAMQDWARYRREKVSTRKRFWNISVLQDLVWHEKSPAVEAIAINVAIAVMPLVGLILVSRSEIDAKISAFFSIGLAASLVIIYAALTQLILFMKAQNRIFWAIGTIGAALFLPPIILGVLSIQPGTTAGFLWFFTAGAPMVVLYPPSGLMSSMMVCFALLGQWTIFGLLNLQLTRQLRIAGESATKALLAGKS